MVACPQCGTQNPPTQPACTCCGAVLPTTQRLPAPPESTLGPGPETGKPLDEPLGPGPETSKPLDEPQLRRTLLGVAPSANRPEPDPVPMARQQTLAGMAPERQLIEPPPTRDPPLSQNRTILGVARPGIAPLAPGVPKATTSDPPALEPRASVPSPEEDAPRPSLPLPGFSRWWLRGGILTGGFLVGALGWVGWQAFERPRLEANVLSDSQGAERLELRCETCSDGTTVSLAGQRSRFQSQRAVLGLMQRLEVGRNRLKLDLLSPTGKSEPIELVVPVDYRIRGDLGGLSEETPKLRVRTVATPGTAVTVDGQSVALDANGAGAAEIDVSAALTGMSNAVERLERKLPFVIKARSGSPQAGEIAFGIAITPLVIEAPHERVVTDAHDFMLAGHTQPGASVSVAGRAIPVDAGGQFAQLMNVSSVGKTTILVRATAAQHAPRLVPIEVSRVDSLRHEALRIQRGATRSYAALTANLGAKAGWLVELEGDVVESRIADHTTVLLLEAVHDCPVRPCLARLLYGAEYPADKGQRLTAYGRVSGVVDGPRAGSRIPELRIDFLLKGPPP